MFYVLPYYFGGNTFELDFLGSFDGGIACILGKSYVIRLYYMVVMGHNWVRLV